MNNEQLINEFIKQISKQLKVYNLHGKDYFTEAEAAFYCGLSLSQFRKIKKEYGIMPGFFGGKKQ